MVKQGSAASRASVAVRAALAAMGPILARVAVWVVVDGRCAGSWAASVGKPRRHGVAALGLALDALAAHYGTGRAA